MRIPLQNGEILMGSISWQKAYSYTWRGKAYIEVPYVFNGVEKIIQGTDTTSYSLVLCVLNKDYFVGAINTRTYTLLDGTEANTWLNDGSRLKSIKSVSRSEKEIAALDAQIKEARKNKKEGNTTVRKAINPIEEEICETYTYSEISPSSGNIDYYGDGSYDFVDTLNKDLENLTVNGYIKQKTVSYCFTEIKAGGFPPPPPLPGGGSPNENTTDFGTLCNKSYNFKLIDGGGARVATVGPIGFSLVNTSGTILTFVFSRTCFTITTNKGKEVWQATEAINDAWNYATDNAKRRANNDNILADWLVKRNMETDIKLYLSENYLGSSFLASECNGTDVKITAPQYCTSR